MSVYLSPSLLVCLSVPKEMEVDLTVSGTVLKQGEVLTVNCTVKDTEIVFFTWDFPRKQVPVCLPDFLSECPSLPVCLNYCVTMGC